MIAILSSSGQETSAFDGAVLGVVVGMMAMLSYRMEAQNVR